MLSIMATRFLLIFVLLLCDIVLVHGQDLETCYGPASIVGAIIGTLLITIALVAICVLLYKIYWRSRKGKHLVLVTDVETPADQYAFDNPCFKEASPVKQEYNERKQAGKLDKTRWLAWSPLQPFVGQKNEKVKALDDSYINESHLNVVSLKSHDFTGLGFSICGNMRDGIFIKDVLHRGPAFESGRINSGDRIDSVCISFRHMVFEDALTILSYASPYEVQVEVENSSSSRPSTLIRSKKEANVSANSQAERICHPFYRSQSIADLAEIGKVNNKRIKQQLAFPADKNMINNCVNRSYDGSQGSPSNYPTLKLSPSPATVKRERQKLEKSEVDWKDSRNVNEDTSPSDKTSKLHKFGIKVLPIGPKMGTQSFFKTDNSYRLDENEKNTSLENKMEKEIPTTPTGSDETDSNFKSLFTKGLQNLKEKINQNSLGRKKYRPNEEIQDDNVTTTVAVSVIEEETVQAPTPRQRANKIQNLLVSSEVPEEVTRAGNAARNNRKSIASLASNDAVELDKTPEKIQVVSLDNINSVKSIAKHYDQSLNNKMETCSSSECSSDRDSDVIARPKRSKAKAPMPPAKFETEDDMITNVSVRTTPQQLEEPQVVMEDKNDINNIFEPPKQSTKICVNDSDSDMDDGSVRHDDLKIELCTTEVTVHPSPPFDNDDEMDNGRKAASLGDLSKFETDKPLTVMLERAVSLDLANGGNQCCKKRKAPLPPPGEFPVGFDNNGYRKEPKLEQQMGLDTFQRRLKKSSDFGTLEDALLDEVDSAVHPTVEATNVSNIREFSSWLEECRKGTEDAQFSFESLNEEQPKVVFSINGKGMCEHTDVESSETVNFPGVNRRTVLVISQPNSLEPLPDQPQFSIVSQEEITEVNNEPTTAEDSVDHFVTATTDSKFEEEDNEDVPPQLPTSPIPVADSSLLSSPLSSSLTYITEIKVSSSQDMSSTTMIKTSDEDTPQSDSLNSHGNNDHEELGPISSTPISKIKPSFNFNDEPTPVKDEEEPCSSRESSQESSNSSSRRGSDTQFEVSKIPIRTLKSETGQKLLATIQSLAVKDQKKSQDNDQAKRVASLFAGVNTQTKVNPMKKDKQTSPKTNVASFYLNTSDRTDEVVKKIPPMVPPRKMDTSNDSTLDSSDRKISTFSTFSPSPKNNQMEPHVVSRLATWSESVVNKDHDGINGGRDIQVQNEVVNLPVKTSATKIIFENKLLDSEEL